MLYQYVVQSFTWNLSKVTEESGFYQNAEKKSHKPIINKTIISICSKFLLASNNWKKQ